ncbi:MAG TPA: DUF6311 domain-containing protein [Rhizomicrobium sp.]|jgi:hypothetical protein|nr:DUF6311 domain-containing protein [Rhizomicrobium sp.]
MRVEGLKLDNSAFLACFAALIGFLDALLLLGWHDINPSNLDWLQGDPAVYQAGWEFLRRSHWTFPPTWISHLDYHFGISAAYLDVIPLLAVPLRLFAGFLPANFQYLGAYAVLCLILQTFFGLKLLQRFTTDRVIIVIGSLFFLNAPVLINRLYGHFSLCSQWLIVAALYYYFAPAGTKRLFSYSFPFAVLLLLASGITPYLAAMVLGIAAAAVVRWFSMQEGEAFRRPAEESSPNFKRTPGALRRTPFSCAAKVLVCFASLLLVMIFAFVLFGFLTLGRPTQLGGTGYMMFSMNLLGPINPGGGALYFKQFEILPGQSFEGYNYLGMGVILLLTICVARHPYLLIRIWNRSTASIIICVGLMALLSLSAKVTIGRTTLFVIPLPQFIIHSLAVFRSSGRFFWPAHYLIALGAITGTVAAFTNQMARRVVLAAAFLIQFLDVLPVRNGVAERSAGRHASPLQAPDWSIAARKHGHLVLLPAWQCDTIRTPGGDADWSYFAWLAARNGMTLNSTHAARDSAPSSAYNCVSLPRQVRRGHFAEDTAYVLSDGVVEAAIRYDTTHYCRRVDGFNFCTYDPPHARDSQLLLGVISPLYRLGTELRSEQSIPKSLHLQNFDTTPGWGLWTVGPKASIDFRVANVPKSPLLLEIQLTNVNTGATHPVQRAYISMNGHRIGTASFRKSDANAKRIIAIPAGIIRENDMNEVRFDLPDAISPRAIGINQDNRPLALYLHRFQIVGAATPATPAVH